MNISRQQFEELSWIAGRDELCRMASARLNGPVHPQTRAFAHAAEFSQARFSALFVPPRDCLDALRAIK